MWCVYHRASGDALDLAQVKYCTQCFCAKLTPTQQIFSLPLSSYYDKCDMMESVCGKTPCLTRDSHTVENQLPRTAFNIFTHFHTRQWEKSVTSVS